MPRSDGGFGSFDQGLISLLTESLNTVEYINNSSKSRTVCVECLEKSEFLLGAHVTHIYPQTLLRRSLKNF